MWKYFFLGLLVGWLIEWIIDWFYWRRGVDGNSHGAWPRSGKPPLRAAAGNTADAGSFPVGDAAASDPAEAEVAGPVVESNAGTTTSADTPAGRVAADVAIGAAGAVSTSSATLTSQAPVYRQEDLEALVGIGPKIGAMLRNNGITTFAELAVSPVEELRRIVQSTGEPAADAGVHTWAAQARLAAAQDWTGLARLQEELQSTGTGARREA